MAGGLPLVNKTPSSILRAEVIAWTIPTFSAMSKTVVEGKRPKPTMRIPDNLSFVFDTFATITTDRDPKNRKGQPLSSHFQQSIRPTAENLGPFNCAVAEWDAASHRLLRFTICSAGRFNFLADSLRRLLCASNKPPPGIMRYPSSECEYVSRTRR